MHHRHFRRLSTNLFPWNPCIRTRHQSSSLSHLRPPTPADLTALRQFVDSDHHCQTDLDVTVDWTRRYQGQASARLRPTSTQQVSQILRYCHDHRIGVIPQGGHTGLVGGTTPFLQNEILLSMELLHNIVGLQPHDGILTTQAGAVLQDLQDYAAARQWYVPLDVGSKGTCQMGGNVATNAGGSYFGRYQSLHATIVAMEAVLPDGQVLGMSTSSHVRKDNTGYDWKHLFLGSEGTLGVVTQVAIQCAPLPRSRQAVWLVCDEGFRQVLDVLQVVREDLGEIVAAVEWMDAAILEIVKVPNSVPLGRYVLLIETHGSNEKHDMEKIQMFLEACLARNLVQEGLLAQSLSQLQEFWKIREACNPSVAALGYVYKFDVSLELSEWPELIHEVREALPNSVLCTNWGHLGDGNLHLNVVQPNSFEKMDDLERILEDKVLGGVIDRDGSISAEHGLGQNKNKYLTRIKDPATLATMRAIKNMFDPHGIMNPGKYLPLDD